MIHMTRRAWTGHPGDHCDSVFASVESQGTDGPRETQSVGLSLWPALVLKITFSRYSVITENRHSCIICKYIQIYKYKS